MLENLEGELHLWSRNERPLLRYFPELQALGERLPPRSAVDGEIVIEREGRLDFDAMQMRLHPAESRVRRLSAEIPARFVVFDVLLWDGEEVWQLPLEERRDRVEALPFDVSPASLDADVAAEWMERLDVAGFDGVVAKRLAEPYRPGSREAVVKIKRIQTADCVVIGLRWAENRERIATMLLGLYDDGGELRYVGTTAVAPKRHDEIAALLNSSAQGRARTRLQRAKSMGQRRARRGRSTARGGRRGALRQVAGHALPPRHETVARPSRQGCGAVRRRAGAAATAPRRSDRLRPSRRVGPPHPRGAEIRTPGRLLPRYRWGALGASLQAHKRLPERRHEVTAMTAQLELKAMAELIERKRISRLIAIGSVSFSALIAIIASLLAIAA